MSGLASIPLALETVATLWRWYFPQEVFNPTDSRLTSVQILLDMLGSDFNNIMRVLDMRNGSLPLSVPYILGKVPFDDFLSILIGQPSEVLGCMGLAASVLLVIEGKVHRPRPIHVMLSDLCAPRPFSDIKSVTVGQLVTVIGYVVRVTASRPMVIEGSFKCPKCGQYTQKYFRDGLFSPPNVCGTDKCYNRYLELDRNSIVVTDLQLIKLQEMEEREAYRVYHSLSDKSTSSQNGSIIDPESAHESTSGYNPRVPRTFNIEVRGMHLVDRCVAGDVLICVGEVKMMQDDAPRGGRGRGAAGTERESGIHHVYIVANSLRTARSSVASVPGRANLVTNPLGGVKRGLESCMDDDDATVGDMYRASKAARSQDDVAAEADGDAALNVIADAGLETVPWLVSSLCPLIFGHELVKLGLLLGLFGGTPRDAYVGKHDEATGSTFSTRSDIHVLVVGDPGLGKSQLLRAATAVAPKAVFVCGNTATTAGLTVSLSRDTGGGRGGDVCIEAGALVLADRGVCCIDELDKMTCDPHSMLEAMEQQQISVAKSGVVTSLKSRATILAAANPVGGHYNRNKSVCENLKMASALLSRFDLVFILLDRADEGHDRMISEHIMGIRKASGSLYSNSQFDVAAESTGGEGIETLSQRLRRQCAAMSDVRRPLDPTLLRRYIEHARCTVFPRLSPAAAKALQKMYLTMRSRGPAGDGLDSAASGAMPVTTRHLESLIRLAQARARMELRSIVTEEDANDVVSLLQESILDTLTSELGVIDIGRKGGMSLAKQVKAVVSALGRLASAKGSNVFSQKEISDTYASLRLPSLSAPKGVRGATAQRLPVPTAVSAMDVDSIIEVMRAECYVILKGPRLYQLQLH